MKSLICLHCGEVNPQDNEKCTHCKTAPKLESAQSLCESCKTVKVNYSNCEVCNCKVKPIANISSSKFSCSRNEKLAEQAEWLKVYIYQLVSKVEIKLTISLVSLLLSGLFLLWIATDQQGGFMLFIYFYLVVIATLLLNLILQMSIGRKLCQRRLNQLVVDPKDKIYIDSDMPKALVESILTNRMKEMVKGITRRHYQKIIPSVIKAYVVWK